MNRKQRTGIVLGGVILLGLALFPPRISTRTWMLTVSPDAAGTGLSGLRFGHSFSRTSGEGDGDRAPNQYVEIGNAHRDDSWASPRTDVTKLLVLQGAALALTVAAVIVLKERKDRGGPHVTHDAAQQT